MKKYLLFIALFALSFALHTNTTEASYVASNIQSIQIVNGTITLAPANTIPTVMAAKYIPYTVCTACGISNVGGTNYSINITRDTQLLNRDGGQISVASFAYGDHINLSGRLQNGVVYAYTITDLDRSVYNSYPAQINSYPYQTSPYQYTNPVYPTTPTYPTYPTYPTNNYNYQNQLTIQAIDSLNISQGAYRSIGFRVTGGYDQAGYTITTNGSDNIPGMTFTQTQCAPGQYCIAAQSNNMIYLTGYPTTAGTYRVNISAQDNPPVPQCANPYYGAPTSACTSPSRHSGSASFTVTVSGNGNNGNPLGNITITSDGPLNVPVGSNISIPFKVATSYAGNQTYTFDTTQSEQVPGMSFNTSSCPPGAYCFVGPVNGTTYLTGTPTRAGTYRLVLSVRTNGYPIGCTDVYNYYGSCATNQLSGSQYGQATFILTVTNLYGGGYGYSVSPVISSVSGPTSLRVNENGMWQVVSSYNQSGTRLTYSVIFGDEPTYYSYGSLQTPTPTYVNNTGTFNHSYLRSGVYTLTFTVTNDSGQSTRSTLTVNVI